MLFAVLERYECCSVIRSSQEYQALSSLGLITYL